MLATTVPIQAAKYPSHPIGDVHVAEPSASRLQPPTRLIRDGMPTSTNAIANIGPKRRRQTAKVALTISPTPSGRNRKLASVAPVRSNILTPTNDSTPAVHPAGAKRVNPSGIVAYDITPIT